MRNTRRLGAVSKLLDATSPRRGVLSRKHWDWMWKSGFMDQQQAMPSDLISTVIEHSKQHTGSGASRLALVPMCGTSADALLLAEGGMDVVAIEVSEEGCERARSSWSKQWKGSNWQDLGVRMVDKEALDGGHATSTVHAARLQVAGAADDSGSILLLQADVFQALPPAEYVQGGAGDMLAALAGGLGCLQGQAVHGDVHVHLPMPRACASLVWDRGGVTSVEPSSREVYLRTLLGCLQGIHLGDEQDGSSCPELEGAAVGGALLVEALHRPATGGGEDGGDGSESEGMSARNLVEMVESASRSVGLDRGRWETEVLLEGGMEGVPGVSRALVKCSVRAA